MTARSHRLPEGGRIDRSRTLSFLFDGQSYLGHPGDTLASALLANGVRVVGRSFKLHRPRGVFAYGVNEPNALVTLGTGVDGEANVRATMIELRQGLVAHSQNRWPSLAFDVMGVNDWFKSAFAAGFYYKTFMGPAKKSWMTYEPWIRRAAGLGRSGTGSDSRRYGRRNITTDVLVVGGGPAGLAAACAAGRMGVRVLLVEQQPELGGSLLEDREGSAAASFVDMMEQELAGLDTVRVLKRTTVFGAYDHGVFGLVERPSPEASPAAGERFIVVRSRAAVVATGALERHVPFGDNDRPGIMLASAARTYLNRYGVLCGRRVVVFTTNDHAYPAALDLAAAGATVSIIDPRPGPGSAMKAAVERAGVGLLSGHVVAEARGRAGVQSVLVAGYDAARGGTQPVWFELPADLVCVSGGYDPQVHLTSQLGGKAVWSDAAASFCSARQVGDAWASGAVTGVMSTTEVIADGLAQGRAAAIAAGGRGDPGGLRVSADLAASESPAAMMPLWDVPPPPSFRRRRKRFIDLQNDVSQSDVALAAREGYVSVEHMKRYTTLGMGTDQGKVANVVGLANLAAVTERAIADVGTTTYRPPYTPISVGALAGLETGQHSTPLRRTSLDLLHEAAGAVFVDAGHWRRPWYYPLKGETIDEAYRREALAVRTTVGMVDVSTLGKIDVQGPDAATFLDRIYVNAMSTLKVGRVRYGVMLRDDGLVLDDGTVARLGDAHFLVTTTTAEAGKVMSHLEGLLATVWPDLKVHVASVTDQWAAIAVAGPRALALLQDAAGARAAWLSGLPHMGLADGVIDGLPVRAHRVSFSGERAYELFVPSGYAAALWRRLAGSGGRHGLTLYGTEAMATLRIEKGHVAGNEIDGRMTLGDLGLAGLAKPGRHFIGSALMRREALMAPERPALVGLVPIDRGQRVRQGAILQPAGGPHEGHGLGHVSSTTFSPILGHYIALGFVAGGSARMGGQVDACSPVHGETVRCEVVSPKFYDPTGARLHA
ncbi:MAG: sarcosine oxidase subunit alpha family protein [Hyphomicrobiaceae bacterium]|nr:sarcosine oxidase subunit alpha family protein [Hyphomicrobiaceae bacterium]